jgi:multidrug resistance efflux pump/WD40 repeat protein
MRYLTIAALVLALIAPLAAVDGDPPVRLRYAWRRGDQFVARARLVLRVDLELVQKAERKVGRTEVESVYRLEVIDVGSSGEAEIKVKVPYTVNRVYEGDRLVGQGDTRLFAALEVLPELTRFYEDAEFSIWVNDRGKVIRARGVEELFERYRLIVEKLIKDPKKREAADLFHEAMWGKDNLLTSLSGLFLPFPEQAVRPGQTWEDDFISRTEVGDVTCSLRYRLAGAPPDAPLRVSAAGGVRFTNKEEGREHEMTRAEATVQAAVDARHGLPFLRKTASRLACRTYETRGEKRTLVERAEVESDEESLIVPLSFQKPALTLNAEVSEGLSLAFLPDGLLVTQGWAQYRGKPNLPGGRDADRPETNAYELTVRLWDTASGKIVRTYTPVRSVVPWPCSLDPTGRRLVWPGVPNRDQRVVRRLDVDTGELWEVDIENGKKSQRTLAGPAVTPERPKELRAPDKLQVVDLSPTRWDHITALGLIRQLQRLQFRGQRRVDEVLARLPRLEQLRELDLTETDVSDEGLRHLSKFPRLEKLDLSGTRLRAKELRHLAVLKDLRELYLAGCVAPDEEILEVLAGLKGLRTLDLGANRSGIKRLDRLEGLTELRELRLGGTFLVEQAVKDLARLPALQTLRLDGRGPDPWLLLQHLRELKQLRELDLDCVGLKDLDLKESLSVARAEEARAKEALTLTTDEVNRTIEEAQAAVEVAKANAVLAKQEYERWTDLAAKGAATPQKAEEVTRAYDAAKAEKRLADAKLAKAEAARARIAVARRDLEAAQGLVAKSQKALDLATVKGLQKVRLTHVKMTETLFRTLAELKELQELTLGDLAYDRRGNRLGDGLKALAALKSLRKLTIDERPDAAFLAALKDLRGLEIELTSVHDAETLEALVQNEVVNFRVALATRELGPANRQAVQDAEAAVQQQVANRRAAQLSLELARADLKRAETLVPDGAISKEELDRRRQAVHVAEAAVDQEVANLRVMQVILELARANLKQDEELAAARGISKEELDQRRQAVQVVEEAVKQQVANHRAAQASLDLAHADYNRAVELVPAGAIGHFDLDVRQQAVHVARAAVDQQDANLRVVQVILELARANLKQGEESAPARGITKEQLNQRRQVLQLVEEAVQRQEVAKHGVAEATLELVRATLKRDEKLARDLGERERPQQAAVVAVDQQDVNLRVALVSLALARANLKRGEPLVSARGISKEELDKLRQAVKDAEAAIERQDVNRRTAEAYLDLARANLKRAEALVPSRDISKEDLDQRRQAVQDAEAAVKQQVANPRVAQVTLALARADLKRGELLVPAGAISKKELDQRRQAVRDAEAAVKQQLADRRGAQETLALARADLKRGMELVPAGRISKEEFNGRRQAVRAAVAAVDQQDANLRVVQVMLELARANLKRDEESAPAGGIRKEELDQRRQAVQVVEEAVNVHRQVANRLTAQAALELARADLKRSEELAPAGDIGKKDLDRRRQAVRVAEAAVDQVANLRVPQVILALARADLKRAESLLPAGAISKEELDQLRQSVQGAALAMKPAAPGKVQTYALTLRRVTDKHLEHLAKLQGVRKLTLRGEGISEDQLQRLAGLKDLQVLDVSDAPLTDRGVQTLSSFPSLRVLNLSRCKLTGSGLRHLAALKELRELNLSANSLKPENLGFLGDVPQLEKLDLSRVDLEDAGLKYLAGMKRLRVLDLSDTKVSAEGVREFLERGFVEEFPKTIGSLGVVRLHLAPGGNRVLADLGPDRATAELVFRDVEGGKTIRLPKADRLPKAEGQTGDSLTLIALAMHKFAADHDHFPPAATFDKEGKPLLSWRVQLLPFVGQEVLYKEFHLDEPWDSEHNKTLLSKMPKVYVRPDGKGNPGETNYLGFVGNGAFFDGKNGLRYPQAFTDGTSNTIMIVEAAKAVPWTKPEDLPFDPAKPPPRIGNRGDGSDVFRVAMCDGSVHTFSNNMKPETLKAFITRDGDEIIDWADADAPEREFKLTGNPIESLPLFEPSAVSLSPDGLRLVEAGGVLARGAAERISTQPKDKQFATFVRDLLLEPDKLMHAHLIVRDLASGRILSTNTREDLGTIVETAFSPDGTILATGSVNGKLALWDLEKRQVLRVIQGYGATPIVFSPDGKKLAAGHASGWTSVWDIATGRELNTIFSTGPVAFSPDGQALATAGPPYAGWGVAHPIALLSDRKRRLDLSSRQDWEEPSPPTADECRDMPHGTPVKLWRLDDPETRAYNADLLGGENDGRPSSQEAVSTDTASLPEGPGLATSSSRRWLLFGALAIVAIAGLWLLVVLRHRYTRPR